MQDMQTIDDCPQSRKEDEYHLLVLEHTMVGFEVVLDSRMLVR